MKQHNQFDDMVIKNCVHEMDENEDMITNKQDYE